MIAIVKNCLRCQRIKPMFFVKDIDDKNLLKDIGVFYCVLLYMKVGKCPNYRC